MATLTERELQVLEAIDCGDEVDVEEIAASLEISRYTLRDRIRSIRAKLNAPTSDVWMEHLPVVAREQGISVHGCADEMPDDGEIRVVPG